MYLLFYLKKDEEGTIEEYKHLAVSHSFDSLLESKQEICDKVNQYKEDVAKWNAERDKVIKEHRKALRKCLKSNKKFIRNFNVNRLKASSWIKGDNEVYSAEYINEKRNQIIDDIVDAGFFTTTSHYSWKYLDEIFDNAEHVQIPTLMWCVKYPETPLENYEEDCLFIDEVKELE